MGKYDKEEIRFMAMHVLSCRNSSIYDERQRFNEVMKELRKRTGLSDTTIIAKLRSLIAE